MTVSDAEYQTWLEADVTKRVLLVEAKYYSGSELTEYMSTLGHITKPTDSPANQEYEDVIQAFPVFRRSMQEAFNGKTQQSFGDLEIINTGGERDDWLDRSWNGRDVTLRLGDGDWDLSDFRTIMSGTIAELTAKSTTTLVLKIRDKGVFLEKEVQETLFGSGPSVDKPLPICYGEVLKVAPVLEDGATHKYKVHDGAISSVDAVYDKGVLLTLTTNYTVDLANGVITLVTQPAGLITADIKGAVVNNINDDPASTNLSLRSEEFDHATWVKTRLTQAANAVEAPDGNTTAETITEDSTASQTHYLNQDITVVDATTYTQSVFVKANTLSMVWIGDGVGNFATVGAWFNLTTGAVGTTQSGWTAVIENYGQGWYRCSVTGASTSTTWSADIALAKTDGAVSYSGDGASDLYIWGGQLEQQTASTSYIPTVGSSVATTATAYKDDIASIIWDIVNNRSDLVTADLKVTNFQSFRLRHPQKVGIYETAHSKFVGVLDKLLVSVGGYWGFSRDGKLALGQLLDPSSSASILTIVADDIVEGGMAIKKRQLPRYRVTLGYQPYAAVQSEADLAGSVTEDSIADLSSQYRLTISEDLSLLTTHLLAHESGVIPTLLADGTEAGTEAVRLKNLQDQIRTTFTVDTFAAPFSVELGDIITIDHDRFGFDSGVKVVVVGYSESVTPPRIKLEVWK